MTGQTEQVVRLVFRVDESGRFVGDVKKGDQVLHELGDTAKTTGKETRNLGRETDGLSSTLLSAERAAGVLKLTLATLGVASVGALLSGSVDSARDFAAALAEVSTLLADTSGVDGLRRELQEIAIEFGKLPEAQAKAFYQIVSAGAETAAEQMSLLRASNRLAVGGITEVEVAADGLTSTLNAFGDTVGSADQVSDKFFATMKGGKTTIGEISSSIGSVAPLAAQLDVSLDEVLATVVAVTKGGDTTSKAMKGMAQAMAAILKPSSEAGELAAELGIEFDAASLATRGWAGFLDHLVDKTDASADKLAVLFGGTEALLPVLTLTGKGAENFAGALEDVGDSSGATGEAVRRVTEEVGAADHNLNQFASSMTVIATELGDPLIETLAPAAKAVADNLFQIVDVGGDLITLLTGLLIAKAAGTAFQFLQVQGALLASNLTFASFASGGLSASLLAQTAAAGGATLAMRSLSAASAFFGGPLGLALAGAATAYVLLGDSTDAAQEATERMRSSTVNLSREIANGTLVSRNAIVEKLREAEANQALARSNVRLLETEIARIKARSDSVLGGQLTDAGAARLFGLQQDLQTLLVDLDNADVNVDQLRQRFGEFAATVTELGVVAENTGEKLALSGEELTAYEKLLATLDPIGTAVDDYRDAVALLDRALATGSIPNQAEYNNLIAALDDELASVLDQEPAEEIRAWAAAQSDLTDATIANNAADKVWIAQRSDAVEKLSEFREGLREEIELAGLTQEQREEELIVRELLNLSKEAGIDLTEEQARAEAEAITVANRSAQERERALNRNLDLYQRFIGEIEDGFKDAFKEAFREGEGSFARLMNGFENLFLDMLAELAFQAIAKPIIVPIVQQIGTGFFGLSGGQVNGVLNQQGLGTQGLGSINGIGGPINSGGAGGFDLSSLSNLFSGGGLGSLGFNAGAGNIGVDLAQLIGGGADTQAIFGNAFARGGSPAGIAGGFAGNFLANTLLGDRGIGANIGGSIGAIAGSFIPIPFVGTALGAFAGNAIGGLFGNNKPSVGEVIGARFGLDGGVLATGTDNGGSGSAAQEFGGQISNILNRILDVTGAAIENEFVIEQSQRNGLMVNRLGGRGHQTFGDDLVGALQFALEGNTAGGDPVFQNLFATADVGSVEELVALLESAEQFKETLDGLTAANDNLTSGEQALKNLTEQMEALREQAVAFGFSVAQIDAAEAIAQDRLAEDFNEGISTALLNALDPVRASAVAMIEQQEARVRDTLALGGDLAAVEKLHLLQRRDFLRQLTEEQRDGISDLIDLTDDFGASLAAVEQGLASAIGEQLNASNQLARAYVSQANNLRRAAENLGNTRTDLRFSENSTLTPLQQLTEARAIVDQLKVDALAGDEEALAELPGAVKRFIEASAAFNADNTQFVADFEEMQALLAKAALIATDTADSAETQIDLLAEQSDLLNDILAALSSPSPDADLLRTQLNELSALNSQLDAPLMFEGFDTFLDGQSRAEDLLGQLVSLAQTDLNAAIGSQADTLAAERIAAIETASAKAIADAQAAAQNQIDAAIARATAAEQAAEDAGTGATARYEEGVFNAFSNSSFGAGQNAGRFTADFSDGISALEAQRALSLSSEARILAFLNPERLLAEANDANARTGIESFLKELGVPGYAGGGHIRGPGSPTSDSIPIMASDNEFMIQASAVDHFGVDFFNALNNGVDPTGNNAAVVGAIGRLEGHLVNVTNAVAAIGGDIVDAVGEGTQVSEQLARDLNRNTRLASRQRGAAA